MRGLCLGFANPVGTGECGTCVCVASRVGGVGGLAKEGGVMYVCLDYLCRWLGGYLCILCEPSVQSCCTLLISASYRVFVWWQISQIQTFLRVVVGSGLI